MMDFFFFFIKRTNNQLFSSGIVLINELISKDQKGEFKDLIQDLIIIF